MCAVIDYRGCRAAQPRAGVLGAIAVEIVIGVLVDADGLALVAFAAAVAVGWTLFRKLRRRQGCPGRDVIRCAEDSAGGTPPRAQARIAGPSARRHRSEQER